MLYCWYYVECHTCIGCYTVYIHIGKINTSRAHSQDCDDQLVLVCMLPICLSWFTSTSWSTNLNTPTIRIIAKRGGIASSLVSWFNWHERVLYSRIRLVPFRNSATLSRDIPLSLSDGAALLRDSLPLSGDSLTRWLSGYWKVFSFCAEDVYPIL